MTTIASNRNRMSADSFVSTGDSSYSTHKIETVGDSLVGCAGPSEWCRKFLAWRRGTLQQPKFKDTQRFEALVLNKTGLYMFENDCVPNRILTGFAAIGSGRTAALAVLHFGGTPQQAVEVACKIDPYSKLPISVLRLTNVDFAASVHK